MNSYTFYIMLSAEEAVEKLRNGLHGRIIKAELLDQYRRILPDGRKIIQLIFQKYSVLANDRPVLIVHLDELEERTKVHLYGATAEGGILQTDMLQTGSNFAQKAKEILESYRVD